MPRIHPNLWDLWDEGVLDQPKVPEYREFYRKSKVNLKALRGFIGRPWNEGFSWISSHKKYNDYRALLGQVDMHRRWGSWGYFVDEAGILQYRSRRRWYRRRYKKPTVICVEDTTYVLRTFFRPTVCGCFYNGIGNTQEQWRCPHGNALRKEDIWQRQVTLPSKEKYTIKISDERTYLWHGIPVGQPYLEEIRVLWSLYEYRSINRKEKRKLQEALDNHIRKGLH